MQRKEGIEQLKKFLRVDKYETFYKIHPAVLSASDNYKEIIADILDDCCSQLIYLLQRDKKPTKTELKKVITETMDTLTHAKVDTENRDFGYELCWYLSEKAGINLKLISENKIWGYWKVEGNKVKTILPKPTHKTAK